MNLEQYLLIKLAEEASEIAQIALKCSQFGLDEVYPEAGVPNHERLSGELNDLLGVLHMLNTEGGLGFEPCNGAVAKKVEKIKKYLSYSKELGKVA